jgi:hypothetical protein
MPIDVFLSYSRKDEAAAGRLASDLERGRISVWRDTELRGGDLWWQTILEKIRSCDVFVLALSNEGLASKPCRAELQYARDLGLPVLPVQIGPVDNLRTAAVGELQIVDYREQTSASGIALFAEVDQAARRRQPLPDPLPLSPPVPFAYLMRLGSAIEKEQLTPAEQGDLVGQLRDSLEVEDDEGVREDARELLRALRRRPDVTFKHAGEIDQVLAGSAAAAPSGRAAAGTATQDRPAPAAAPSASPAAAPPIGRGYTPPPPRYGPPPGGGPPMGPAYAPVVPPPTPPGKSRGPLLIVLGALVTAGLVVGGVLLFSGDGDGPTPTPTTAPTTEPGPTTEPSPEPSPEDDLLAVLPGDFDETSCSSAPLAGDGDVAALTCGPAFTQPGPSGAQFHLYPDGTVDEVFVDDLAVFGVPPHSGGLVCPDVLGYSGYTNNGEPRGQAACFVGPDGTSYIVWTDDEFDVEGIVTLTNGGFAGVYTLWDWWGDSAHSAFG